jgi:hypothetical protein
MPGHLIAEAELAGEPDGGRRRDKRDPFLETAGGWTW